MMPHTSDTPKPLLLMGSPSRRIIDYPLDISTQCSELTFVSGHRMADQVDEYVGRRSGVQFLQDKRAVGCAGSMLEHYDEFSGLDSRGDLLFLPSDHVTERLPVEEFLSMHHSLDADLTLMTIAPKKYGEYVTVIDNIAKSVERQKTEDAYSSTGIFIFKNRYLLDLLSQKRHGGWHNEPLNTYHDVVVPAIGQGRRVATFPLPEDGYWDDAGTPERYHANNMRLSHDQTVISSEAQVGANARFNRCVVLGGVAIGGAVNLANAIISQDRHGTNITIISDH